MKSLLTTCKRVGGRHIGIWREDVRRGGGGQVTAPRDQVQSWACVSNKQAASPSTWRSSRALEPCYCKPSACRPRGGSARSAWPLQQLRSARDATALLLYLLLRLPRLLLRRDDTTAPSPGTTCASGSWTARTPVSFNPGLGPRRTKKSCGGSPTPPPNVAFNVDQQTIAFGPQPAGSRKLRHMMSAWVESKKFRIPDRWHGTVWVSFYIRFYFI